MKNLILLASGVKYETDGTKVAQVKISSRTLKFMHESVAARIAKFKENMNWDDWKDKIVLEELLQFQKELDEVNDEFTLR